ncbi:MAG: TenA family protein [Vicinamibacterales bacterium]
MRRRNALRVIAGTVGLFALEARRGVARARLDGSGRFTAELWAGSRDIYEAIVRHPFLVELQAGTLAREAFAFYMVQDAAYLRAFGEALKATAAKAPRAGWRTLLEGHAAASLAEELRLHSSVFREYGISPADVAATPAAPDAFAYTSFLVATAQTRPFGESMSALLPCYWIYWEVGKTLRKTGSKSPTYQRWIDNYSSADYGETVAAVLDIVDTVAPDAGADGRRRMVELFRQASRYEWMFWDCAYHQRRWPVG